MQLGMSRLRGASCEGDGGGRLVVLDTVHPTLDRGGGNGRMHGTGQEEICMYVHTWMRSTRYTSGCLLVARCEMNG